MSNNTTQRPIPPQDPKIAAAQALADALNQVSSLQGLYLAIRGTDKATCAAALRIFAPQIQSVRENIERALQQFDTLSPIVLDADHRNLRHAGQDMQRCLLTLEHVRYGYAGYALGRSSRGVSGGEYVDLKTRGLWDLHVKAKEAMGRILRGARDVGII